VPDSQGFGFDLPRAQAHRQMAFRARSSSPLTRTASAAGARQAATQASAWDNHDATEDINSASGEPRPKFLSAFCVEFQ
jgi:hypothetical protein